MHLARATGRRALMEAELARVGITANYWNAVDGRDDANARRLAALPDSGPWGRMDGHAKGCLASHLDAFAAFLDGTSSHLLMLEDDTFLADDLNAWLSGDYWPKDANVIKLERWRDDRLKLLVDRQEQRHGGREMHRLRSRHSGSAGYIIDRAGAQLVLSSAIVDLPVDQLLFNPYVSAVARQLVIYQVFPALITQGNEPQPGPVAKGPKSRKSLSHKLQRLAAELMILRQIPRLLSGRAYLTSIAWQSNVGSKPGTQVNPKG
ncbi:MAG: glycosyltransferase family 25 protein [Cypionkella sp.]